MPTISLEETQEAQEAKAPETVSATDQVVQNIPQAEQPSVQEASSASGGEVQEGAVETESPVAEEDKPSMRTLSQENATPKKKGIKKEDEKSKKSKKSLFQRLSAIGTVSSREVVEFTRHLAVMLGAGITIFEAILFLKDQARNKIFRDRLESVVESLNNGQALSNAMRRFPKIFPPIYTNIIQVGEKSGTLAQTMVDLADHLEDSEEFRRKVKGALIYPKIIIGVMLTFIFILILFVMPRILTIFNSLGADIPLATRVMIGVTNFINNHLVMIFAVGFGLAVLIYMLFRNPGVQKWRDKVYIRFPLVGHIVLNYNTAQVSQHFGTLFASGITIVRCLEITSTVVKNKIFRSEIGYMIEKIKRGAALSQSFPEKSFFPPMFIKLIRVGERTGKLPHVVEYMKKYYKNLVDNDVKNITTIIEPVIMVLLGLMVAGLVITVIGPIYQLISNVGQ
ncbi:type II secretion system F family protein [Patescibacteria group bacterium]|nr:type II secretion system F family protein [Patescibacteria group bacterium]